MGFVFRDFKAKYLHSILGTFWAILHPLALIFVYTIIFSRVMQAKLPGVNDLLGYSIYLCAGLLPWTFFQETLSRHLNVFIEHGNILKKVHFPRSALPVYIHLSSGINFLIIFSIFLAFLLITGRFPGWVVLGIIPLILLQQAFALGMGIIFGVLNVFFRDVGHFINILLQFWFWLTPIVYPLSVVPEEFTHLFLLNPMVHIMKNFQAIFLFHEWPDWTSLGAVCIGTMILNIVGYAIFKKLEKEMVDEL